MQIKVNGENTICNTLRSRVVNIFNIIFTEGDEEFKGRPLYLDAQATTPMVIHMLRPVT